jgi:hypothetical protein
LGNRAADLEGAGRRIDLPVEHGELAGVRIERAIDQEQLERHVLRLFLAGGDGALATLRYSRSLMLK